MNRKGALSYHVNPIILLVIDPCCDPLRPGLLLHPYGWLTRQLQLAAQVPYASFRNVSESLRKPLEALRKLAQTSVSPREVYGRFRKFAQSFWKLPETLMNER